MEATYTDGKRAAEVGDIVMAGGNKRSVVVDVSGTFVTIIAIGLSKETGKAVVLPPADDCPARQFASCSFDGDDIAPKALCLRTPHFCGREARELERTS